MNDDKTKLILLNGKKNKNNPLTVDELKLKEEFLKLENKYNSILHVFDEIYNNNKDTALIDESILELIFSIYLQGIINTSAKFMGINLNSAVQIEEE